MAKFVTLHTEEEVRATAFADALWWRYVGVEGVNKETVRDVESTVHMWKIRNARPALQRSWESGILVEDNNDEENNE